MGTLITNNVVRVAEDVEERIYNFRPSDTPLISGLARPKVSARLHEWTADTYRAPDPNNARIEGADATFPTPAQPGQYGNRTQIIEDSLKISGTTEAVKKYGRKSEVARLKTKKMVELKLDIEAAAIANPTAVTGDAATAGKMRGLYGWIATNNSLGVNGVAPNPLTNTAPTAGTLRAYTEPLLKSVILGTYTNGGDASVLLTSPTHKQTVSGFTGNVQRTNEVGDRRNPTLQTAFTFYGHDFGVTKVVPNRVMTGAGAGLINTDYVVDYDKLALGQLRPFQSTELAKTGDAEAWQILTEVTLIVRQESTLGAIRDLNP
jgi:hypothetical protein